MAINVEIQKTGTESATSTLKRFTKRVQGSGVLNKVRSLRYAKRAESPYVRKKRALKSLRRRTEYQKMVKLGKAVENTR